MTLGATPDDWFHFDFVLGLGSNLLPCVPAGPDVKVLKGSALEGKVGKIPSQFNHSGEAHGLKDWQKRPIMSNEIVAWSKDPRLNICVRLGPLSHVYAFDIDIDDERAAEAATTIARMCGVEMRARTRENSRKLLIPFTMEESCKKRKIKLDNSPKGPAIELLADGQQFVAAGLHSSGVRYQWLPSLPEHFPNLSLEVVNQIWATLTATYATTSSKLENQIASALATPGTATSTSATSSQSLAPLVSTGSLQSASAQSEQSALTALSEDEWQQLLGALRFLTDKVADNDTWSEVGYALLSLQATRPAKQLWIDFSKKAAGYVEGAAEEWWNAHANQTPRTDYRHIFNMARQRGHARVADPALFEPVAEDAAPLPPISEQEAGDARGDADAEAAGSLLSDAPIKPLIQLVAGRYPQIIDQMETLLVPYAYVQGPHLVRQTEAHTDAHITRAEDALMLSMVTPAWLRKRLGELATVQKWLKSEAAWVSADLTGDYISGVLDLGGWTRLRPLDAIARAPFVREDGSICDVAGYDSRARVLYVPGTTFPDIPADPSQDSAREALGRIRGVFDQFPWKEDASESAFLSHILTEAARLACDRSPMFFYDAPSAGTGKGLLQEMAARIVHGSEPAIRPWVSDGDEIRKSLYASLLAGDRSLWFDNVPNGQKIRSPELCAFITSSVWKDRKLGESETLGVPNKCVLVASGNNITPVSDMARRSLVVRMDANTERMKERVFKIANLRTYVMEHRASLLVDALTIIKAYHAATDAPPMPVPLPSFERWSHFCRDPLIWLGLPDPVITQNETDDETASVGKIYEALVANFSNREFAGLDVARLVNGIADASGELASELIENGCSEPNNPKKVGYWLRGCRDRISAGYKLVQGGRDGHKGTKWRLVRMNEDLT